MIDFEKELLKFDFMDSEKYIDKQGQGELENIIQEFNKVVGKIAKEQNKANIQLEELVVMMDENEEAQKDKEQTLASAKEDKTKLRNEKFILIEGLIEILDQIENLYKISKKHENDIWFEQISLMWNLISKTLLSIGITRIDDEYTTYTPFLNTIVSTKDDTQLEEGYVLEVLKSGYFYEGKVLRRSEVIVNKYTRDKGEI